MDPGAVALFKLGISSVTNNHGKQFSGGELRPEAASQLAEMTHPNQPFISASEGQQVLISMAAHQQRWVDSLVIIFPLVTNRTDDDGAVIDYFIKCHIA